MKEITGNIIELAKEGHFDMIIHGCNCFCTMGAGLAKQIKDVFPKAFEADCKTKKGDMLKLGGLTGSSERTNDGNPLLVINAYTQYDYNATNKPIDYEALILCLRKINHLYKGKSVAVPRMGAGLAGGDWAKIKGIIKHELSGMSVTIINFNN